MVISLESRIEEIDRLATRGGPREVRALMELLGDDEWQTRRAAATAIAAIIPVLTNVQKRDLAIAELLRTVGSLADAPRRAAAIVALEAIGRMALPHLAVALAEAPASTRSALAGVIGGAGGAGAVSLLEPLSQESDQNVAAASILALGRTRSPEALPLLLTRLDGDDEWLKFAAIGALGELGDGRAVGPLAELTQDPLLRETAIASLVEIGTIDAARVLGDQVVGADGIEIRSDALTALVSVVAHARTQPPAIADAIQNVALHSIPSAAREILLATFARSLPSGETATVNACLTALSWLGELRALPLVIQSLSDCAFAQTGRDVLIAAAATDEGVAEILALTPDRLPQIEAAQTLSEVRSAAALEGSLQLLNEALDEETEHACLTALTVNANWLRMSGHLISPAIRERLTDLLRARLAARDAGQTVEVARTLGMLAANWSRDRILATNQELCATGYEGGVMGSLAFLAECDPSLAATAATKWLKHPAARVRVAAIETVARCSGGTSPISFASHLMDESTAVRRAAARSQRWLGAGDEARRALTTSLTDDDIWVRVEAIATLAAVAGDDPGVAKRLGGELFSNHPLCRVAAIEAQRSLPNPDWIKLEDLARRDQHPEVRTAAVRVLAGHPRRSVVASHLANALTDPDWAVRFTSIDLAIALDQRDMADALAYLAGDLGEVPAVRGHSIRALAIWLHPAAVRIAVMGLDDPAASVVETAFSVLARLGHDRADELEAHRLHCSPRAANHINFILNSTDPNHTAGPEPAVPASPLNAHEPV